MNETPDLPWIHIGECPVCVNGLVRVRACMGVVSEPHFYALCDECEALWVMPDTAAEFVYTDPENPQCPTCSLPLFGPQARWATPTDLAGTDWAAQAIYTLPGGTLEEPLPPNGASEAGSDQLAKLDRPLKSDVGQPAKDQTDADNS